MFFLRIRDLREDRDFTQQQLAAYLQIHQTTYSSYELGKLGVPVDVLVRLADFYNVSVDYLFGRTDVQTPYPKSTHPPRSS